jgi:hypothetical protein
MIEADITKALQDAVAAAVGASTLPALPIAYLDRVFTPPNDSKYVEIVQIPNNPDGEFWNDERNYAGILRVILHWPINNEGRYPPVRALDSIAGYFIKTRALSNGVKLTSVPNFTGPLEGKGDMLYPFSVRYQRFAA